MFKKSFIKYARAINDEAERKAIYKKYLVKKIAALVFFVLSFAVVAESFVASLNEDLDLIGSPLMNVTVVLWLISGIAAFVLFLAYRSLFKGILHRDPVLYELPEITSYRKKTAESQLRTKKSTRWSLVLFIASCLLFLILFIIESALYPDIHSLGTLSKIGLYIMTGCAVVFALTMILFNYKNAVTNQNIEFETADEVKVIDLAQGRVHKYSLLEDKNLQSYRYLYPTPELCFKAESIHAHHTKVLYASIIIFFATGILATALIFGDWFFDLHLKAFAIPCFFAFYITGITISTLPSEIKLKKVEKEQAAILKQTPAFNKNYQIYNLYADYSHFKGRIMAIFAILSVIIGIIIGVFYPDKMINTPAILVLLILGIVLNQHFVTQLRKKALPIEEEIDRAEKLLYDVSFDILQQSDNSSVVVNQYNIYTTNTDEYGYSLYLGNSYISLELSLEDDTVRKISGNFELDSVKKASVNLPDRFEEGTLKLQTNLSLSQGAARRITFDSDITYDENTKALFLGSISVQDFTVKIFDNAFAKIDALGTLTGIIISGVTL